MRTLVIGDIHGCYVELQELLEKADLTREYKVIALAISLIGVWSHPIQGYLA